MSQTSTPLSSPGAADPDQAVAATGDAVDRAVAEARARYADSRPASAATQAEAARWLPGGNTRTVLYFDPFPFRVARAWDCHLEDVDGHVYVDLLGEFTAGLYGHSNPVIREAVTAALADGISFGAHNTYEARLAAEVCRRFGSVERVRFTNSGTEANLMAVSLARVATGREALLAFDGGYHGGLLSFAHGGSAVNAPYPVVLGRYNDVADAERLFAEHGDRLAAVLVEPMLGSAGCLPGDPAFLGRLRELADRHGAPLVLDEVMTSRLAPGGLQELLGLRPDLTTLGKYVGGGLSFGAFGGRADLLARFDPTAPGALQHAGTFNNNVLSMAAGLAGLTRVLTPAAQQGLNDRGDRLRTGLEATFRAAGAPFCATGRGSMVGIHPSPGPVRTVADAEGGDDRLRELLFLGLLERGYYLARRGFVALSLEVTDAHVDGALDAVREVLAGSALLRT
jgi:glutamate-1-semialdehyde 2,1-aminomutase